MLPKAQVTLLVERGRELTDTIEAYLARRKVLQTEEDESFSAGRSAELQRLREERHIVEQEAHARRSELSTALQELAGHAADCLREYRQEVTAQGGVFAALSVPSSVEPDRIQECRRYFQDVEQAVSDVTSHLTEFRRKQLRATVEKLRALVEQLRAFGEQLDAIEEYLEEETYLDLSLADAQKRLRDEQSLVEHRLADCERRHREREREERIIQARTALDRLTGAEAASASTWEDDLNLAVILLDQGTPEDIRCFWRAVGSILRAGLPAVQNRLIGLTAEALLKRYLEHTDEERPFELLTELGSDALRALDLRLATDSRQISFLISGYRSSDITEKLSLGWFCKLKEKLPATSFELLRMTEEDTRLNTRDLATWFLSPPLSWPDCEQATKWLAHNFEERSAWRNAYACWGMVSSEAARQRRLATLLIAVAENPRLVPASEGTWWDILTTSPGIYTSDFVATVAAVATLTLGRRAAFGSKDLLESCVGAIGEHPQLQAVLKLAVQAWPQLLPDFFKKVDMCLCEQKELQEKVKLFLKTVKTPAGLPSREFYRDILLPELNEVFQQGGASALKELEPSLVRQLLTVHSLRGMNPVAVQVTERLVQELKELGAQLVVAETSLAQMSVSEGSPDLIDSLTNESKMLASRDPPLQWAYSRIEEVMRGTESTSPAPATISFSPSSLVANLFLDNPVVELAENGTPQGEQLFAASLEELRNEQNLVDWRVQCAVEHGAFDLADRYCADASLADQTRLKEYISQSWLSAKKETTDLLEIASQYIDSLELTEEVEFARLYLEEAKIALDRRDLLNAGKSIQHVVTECDRIEEAQRQARRQIIVETREAVARGFEQLCLKGPGVLPELAPLLVAAVHAADSNGLRAANKLGVAITNLLAGRSFDRSLIADAPAEPKRIELPVLLEKGIQELPESAVFVPERAPIELASLPRLVQLEIEEVARSEPTETLDRHAAWAVIAADAPNPRRIRAAIELFRAERHMDGRWEEPLVAFLEERGHEALKEADYLRAADYYLAATQVAYCASTRLDKGIEAIRRASRNYALAKLMRLRASSGLKPTEVRPVVEASPRGWVNVIREYLLLHGASDLVEVLETLLQAAPDLAPEFLELPLGELHMLRPTLTRALLDRLDSLTLSRRALLEFMLVCGLSATSRVEVVQFLSKFNDVVSHAVEGRSSVPGTFAAKAIEEIETAVGALPLAEQVRQFFQEAIRRLQPEEDSIPEASGAEANIATVTKELFLDTFEVTEDVPVHVRISLTPQPLALRDLVVSFRSEHPEFEVSRSYQTVDLPWLRAGDPVELTCYVRQRSSRADQGPKIMQSPGELVLEVSDVGKRQGGKVRVGFVPYRGRRLTVQVRPTYPYSSRANPYSPGPAVKDLAIIKGRAEETREILRTLCGTHQDNVPLVWGSRRIGKSTLLYRVKLDPEVRRHYEAVVCDMEGLVRQNDTTFRFLARLADRINGQLVGTPAGRIPVPDVRSAQDPLDAFQGYLDKLTSACGNRALLLMFDEMELFFDTLRDQQKSEAYGRYDSALHEDIVRLLRHNMQHNRRISFIMAGTKRLLDITGEAGERLFQLPVPIQVGELRETDANALISEPIDDTFTYSSAARQKLLFLTARHPYLLQAICHEVFSFMQDHRLSVSTTTELDRIIHERVLQQPSYFEFQVQPLKKSPEKLLIARAVAELTQEERRTDSSSVQARIELQEGTFPVIDVTAELRALADEGVLTEWHSEYRFRFPIVSLYVSKMIGAN